MMQWIKVEHVLASQIQAQELIQIVVEDKEIILTKIIDSYYAFTAHCPHAGAALKNGFIDARGCVVCPLHHYRYDVRNGFNKSGEGYKLKTFPVKIMGQQIFISLRS